MALLKSIPTNFGVDATYWNIGGIDEDFKGRGVTVTLYGYVTEDARRNNKEPVSATKYQFVDTDYSPDITRAQLYDLVAAKKEFKDAQSDVPADQT